MASPSAKLIGIDVGTSGCKTIVIDAQGRVLARHLVEYPLSTPKPGWAEQDPDLWWRAALDGLRAVVGEIGDRSSILAIGLSGQMHGLVPLDRDDRVIRPAILWNDQRTAAQCRAITEAAGGLDGLLAMTNNQMLIGYTGSKITWLRDEEPAHFERLRCVINPKDHIRLELTGEKATDVSDASGTGLFDVRNRRWSFELIDRIGLDRSLFQRAHESHAVTGRLRPSLSAELGLPAGLPVMAGGGDAVIQTTGSGLIEPGIVQSIIGTAGIAATALADCPDNPDGRLQIFCNNSPDRWHCMGVSMNAGGAFNWLRNTLSAFAGRKLDFNALTALAEDVAPGAEGLFFLPWLLGERCPHPDPNARGGFVGLTLRHGPGEIIRAAMEGVVYSMRDMFELMRPLGVDPREVRASGGGAASLLWRQMQADIIGAEVVTVAGAAEGGAYGAALVAGVGAGVWSDLESACAMVEVETRLVPDTARKPAYDAAYGIYHDFYERLKPQFDRIAEMG
ncbi:MAG: xylulokinase [Geminicoccaceae bacterium]|nr:xylulokinase [Geminicoccaceae bacterium]